MYQAIFGHKPLIIAAMHLPTQQVLLGDLSVTWLEDFVAKNLKIFSDAGIGCVKLQDQFATTRVARPEVIALMASIGRFAHQEFPGLKFGIIIEAHDPFASLAVANACNATFVRIKGFVGAMVKADGIIQGCGSEAFAYRSSLRRNDIAVFADVHDRTGYPLSNEPITFAADWAAFNGADALVLTGHSFDHSKKIIQDVRAHGVLLPLILGGGANSANICDALSFADGVIVSSALKLKGAKPTDLIQWDRKKVVEFVDAIK